MKRRATDRGSWRLVMKREFWVRLRDRGFLISTAITVTVLSVFIIGNAVAGNKEPSFRLAVAEADRPFADTVSQVAHEKNVDLTVSIVPDLAAAEQAVRSGAVSAAVVGSEFIVKTERVAGPRGRGRRGAPAAGDRAISSRAGVCRPERSARSSIRRRWCDDRSSRRRRRSGR